MGSILLDPKAIVTPCPLEAVFIGSSIDGRNATISLATVKK